MLKDGGIFVSCVGSDGWFGHGFYQIGPDIPWRYWHASLGYNVLGVWTFSRRGTEGPRVIEDPTGKPRGGEFSYTKPQFIFYVVQKTAVSIILKIMTTLVRTTRGSRAHIPK